MHARVAVLALLAACQSAPAAPPTRSGAADAKPGPGATTAAQAPRAAGPAAGAGAVNADMSRATDILRAQVASLRNGDDAFVASFAADAVVLVPDARAAHGDTTGLREAIARLNPHDTLKDVKIVKVIAGSSPSAVWWSAELTLIVDSKEPESPPHATETVLRLTELATADAGWKVVAGAFAAVAKPENRADPDEIDASSTTAPGPLTPLLADPAKLDASLAPHAVVFGTDKAEAAWDIAAGHTLLKSWIKLALSINGQPRELRGKHWGFAIADVDWKQPKEKSPARMAALVIATPASATTWQVVAVQYTAY